LDRDRATRAWRWLDLRDPPSPATICAKTLTMVGSGAPGVTEEDEMNSRLVSEMAQLARWGQRIAIGSAYNDNDAAASLSPIVRDALAEALLAEKKCETLFNVFNPPETPAETQFEISPQGTPRFSHNASGRNSGRNSFNSQIRGGNSRQALVDLDGGYFH
jgi:hypothetical protein